MIKDWLISENFSETKENTFRLTFEEKDKEVIDLFLKLYQITQENDFVILKNNKIVFLTNLLEISLNNKELLIEDLEYIVFFAKNTNIKNPIELLISRKENVFYDIFFEIVKENYLKYSFLKKYLNDLKNLGLVFDSSKIKNFNKNEEFIAINCIDYIKFIPYDEFNEENRLNAIIEEVKEYYHESTEITNWIEVHFLRHLRKNPFNSNEIYHIIDWMRSLDDKTILKSSMPYPKALSKADRWATSQEQNHTLNSFIDIEGTDIVTLESYKGFELVHLKSSESKIREGIKMKNCIKTSIHSNSKDLYSIRYQGKRIASLKINDGLIQELKGPVNKEVKDTYWNDVYQILINYKIDFSNKNHRDLFNIGLKQYSITLDDGENLTFIGQSNSREMASSIDSLFYLKKELDISIILNQITLKETNERKLIILEKIQKYISSYFQPCPITGFLISSKVDKVYFSLMNDFSKVINKFELESLFQELLENQIETKKEKNFGLIFNKTIEFLLNNNYILDDYLDKTNKQLFLKTLILNNPLLENLQYHIALYNSNRTTGSVTASLCLDLGLDTFIWAIKNIDGFSLEYDPKVFKIFSIGVNYDSLENLKDAPSYNCNCCNNSEILDKYSDLVYEHKNASGKIDDLIRLEERKVQLTNDIENVLNILISFIKNVFELRLNIEKNPTNYSTKSILYKLNEIILKTESELEEYDYTKQKISNIVSEFGDFVNETYKEMVNLEDIISQINDLISKTNKCEGCQNCEGKAVFDEEDNEIECSVCKGDSSACDFEIPSPDNYNSEEFTKSFEQINQGDGFRWSSRYPFDCSWISTLFDEVHDFIKNKKESKRLFIDSQI